MVRITASHQIGPGSRPSTVSVFFHSEIIIFWYNYECYIVNTNYEAQIIFFPSQFIEYCKNVRCARKYMIVIMYETLFQSL